jgi:hypothetical protein
LGFDAGLAATRRGCPWSESLRVADFDEIQALCCQPSGRPHMRNFVYSVLLAFELKGISFDGEVGARTFYQAVVKAFLPLEGR